MASRFKYNKKAGALQDAMVAHGSEPPIVQQAELSPSGSSSQGMRQAINALANDKVPARPSRRSRRRVVAQTRSNVMLPAEAPEEAAEAEDFAEEQAFDIDDLLDHVVESNVDLPAPQTTRGPVRSPEDARRAPPRVADSALDPHVHPGWSTMFFHTVEEGQRVIVTDRSGRLEIVDGPKRIFSWGKQFRPMAHHVAHPGDFLVVRYRDGRQEHLAGPAHCWFDPRVHLSVEREEAVQISAKEAVVVYCEGETEVSRRVVTGPATFVPAPGEWLHTFRWHGPAPHATGFQKVPGALVFEKLWLMPDQMYHDVPDVRTADDAVLTIRLMLFFEMIDIERMLESTHDPIGDFINAATSDVVDFVGRCSLDAFKAKTEALNDLATYRQLTARAEGCGYRIDKVVYRGYGAPPALQRLHDEATQSRVQLQLQRATEEQAQELEDFKLDRSLARASKERERQHAEAEHQLSMTEAQAAAARERARLDAEQAEALADAQARRQREHFAELAKLGVDLTALMTKGAADHTIEVRGGGTPHLHVDRAG